MKNLKGILLSEGRQSEKSTYCRIPTIRHSGKDRMMETGKRVTKSLEESRGEMSG